MKPRWAFLVILGGAMTVSWSPMALAAEEPPKVDPWDCGTVSLYHLLRLTGHSLDIDGLQVVLGTPGAEGHSFHQLREAAGHFGLSVDAVVLPKRRSAIQGPVLLFAKLGQEGHFFVVRPVGHTGRLVQLLEGDRPPSVVDAERLFNSRAWTGLALVPHQPNYLALGAAGLAVGCMAVFVSRLWERAQRQPPLGAHRASD